MQVIMSLAEQPHKNIRWISDRRAPRSNELPWTDYARNNSNIADLVGLT